MKDISKMLCYDGKLSLFCFIVAALISILPEILLRLEFDIPWAYHSNLCITHLFEFGLLNFLLLLAFRGFSYKVSVKLMLFLYL